MTMKTSSAIKEPMVWLMFGIPLLTVIAGIYTLNIAGKANATDVINMPVTRVAQIQQSDFTADEAAARANISARLDISSGQWVISSPVKFTNLQLVLDLQHPIDKAKDIRLVLNKQGDRFVSNQAVIKNNDWILQLSDMKSQWRLVGRLHKQNNTAVLQASVGVP